MSGERKRKCEMIEKVGWDMERKNRERYGEWK